MNSNIKRGVSYDRVSTFGQVQDENGFRKTDASPEAQRQRCIDYVNVLSKQKCLTYKIVDHVSDEGFSGKNLNRPGFQRMWDMISSRQIDFIVATELSRLSRNVVDFLDLVSHCEKNNVSIFVIGLSLDTSMPMGRVLVIILVALAQFEREMTSVRVRENALARLLKDGKINGSTEILGLVRDPERKGHYVIDEVEVELLEKILKLFLTVSSKKKLLQMAKEMGLTGRKGRELTQHTLDIILENVSWRYRGIWYANKKNKNIGHQEVLPESQRYQIVKLPHGPVVDTKLLDAVQNKIADTYAKKKRAGKQNHVYLLSHLLVYEDDTPFSGQPGKGFLYRYYYNRERKLRIRCDQIEPFIVGEIKSDLLENNRFKELVADAIKRRQAELPKLDSQIRALETQKKEFESRDSELRQQLMVRGKLANPEFLHWLESQVQAMANDRRMVEVELENLMRARHSLLQSSGLDDLQKKAKQLLGRFDSLSRVEQQRLLECFIKKIVVKPENLLELHLYTDGSGVRPTVTLRNKSLVCEVNGGSDGT